MQVRRTRYGFTLRLDRGEEILAALTEFAEREGIRAGSISGIGAVSEAELGFFVRATGLYERRRVTEEMEVGALTGNFSELDGKPFPHCHAVLAGSDFAARTGHLFRGVVSVTCEIHVVTDPEAQRRVRGPGGFNPLELAPGETGGP